MKNTTDARVEFVELVNGPTAVNVPQNAVIQHKVVGHVERRTISRVVVSTLGVMETRKSAASCNVVDLTENQHSVTHSPLCHVYIFPCVTSVIVTVWICR